MTAPGFELHGAVHRYAGSGQGVHGVTLTVAPGELVAVIGASGCGKSTLLQLVAGLLPLHSGELRIGGREMSGVPAWRRGVGMVFQSYALFPHLDLADNVAYGLRMRGMPLADRRRAARAMLATVGLEEMAARRPSQLSGGQQQRVALARALVFRPEVLLLDEPLAALDAHIRRQLGDELRTLQQRHGAATLMVTHDQQEAMALADRVAVMDGGRLLQIDAPRALYDRPASTAVARFVGQANLLPARVGAPGWLHTPWGPLQADTTGHAGGAAVTVLVRPERLRAAREPDAANTVAGRLAGVRDLGPTFRWELHGLGSAGHPAAVLKGVGPVPNDGRVTLPADALHLLPPEDESPPATGLTATRPPLHPLEPTP